MDSNLHESSVLSLIPSELHMANGNSAAIGPDEVLHKGMAFHCFLLLSLDKIRSLRHGTNILTGASNIELKTT